MPFSKKTLISASAILLTTLAITLLSLSSFSGIFSGEPTAQASAQTYSDFTYVPTYDYLPTTSPFIVDDLPQMHPYPVYSNPSGDVVSVLENEGFNFLLAALMEAKLAGTIAESQDITILAPTDRAFMSLPNELLDSLLAPENRDLLTSVLTYHVLPEHLESTELLSRNSLPTLQGTQIPNPQTLALGQTDIFADRGVVIHTLNEVLLPPNLPALQGVTVGHEVASSHFQMRVHAPTPHAHLHGIEVFELEVPGLHPDEYQAYWQVDGGHLNELVSTDHGKIAYVNVAAWHWSESGDYTVTLSVAQHSQLLDIDDFKINTATRKSAHPEYLRH